MVNTVNHTSISHQFSHTYPFDVSNPREELAAGLEVQRVEVLVGVEGLRHWWQLSDVRAHRVPLLCVALGWLSMLLTMRLMPAFGRLVAEVWVLLSVPWEKTKLGGGKEREQLGSIPLHDILERTVLQKLSHQRVELCRLDPIRHNCVCCILNEDPASNGLVNHDSRQRAAM